MTKRIICASLVTGLLLAAPFGREVCRASETQTIEEMDLETAIDVILKKTERETVAGYPLEESFFLWMGSVYGDDMVEEIARQIENGEMTVADWHRLTGASLHALYMQYCKDMGISNSKTEDVYWKDCKSTDETVVSFTGDFNLAEGWSTTKYMESQPDGIYDCFSESLIQEMQKSDVLVMNNEFVYSDGGEPLAGKAYTFRAKPEMIKKLEVFGTDLVTLANNHTYDYGEQALKDTLHYLREEQIPYSGAGYNLKDASRIVSFIANGWKISVVSATEIERSVKYTRQATENDAGVLKTLEPEYFLELIQKAKKTSDYTIVVCHWGTEGNLSHDMMQETLAYRFAQAGADAIIGGHPHRLQGAAFMEGIPVAYSIGNFWFSDATLYTTVTQIVISKEGDLTLKYLPCLQKDLTTSLITDTTEKEEFYHYLAAISKGIGIDAAGSVYDKTAENYPAEQILYDSESSTTQIWGGIDNEGNAIDIIGNRK